jgi:hypothetical protein
MNGGSFMFKKKMLNCPWEQFEEIIRNAIGSDFIWKIRPGDTEANRQAVMESIERTLKQHNSSFPEKGDMFIEPEKRESASSENETC